MPIPKLAGNDYLRLASTFHSLHAITARGIDISPLPSSSPVANAVGASGDSGQKSGITVIEAAHFRLHCLATLSGLKFLLIGGPDCKGLDKVLNAIYLLYVDFVLKNAFYELEMPIRVELFDNKLLQHITQSQPTTTR